MHVRFDFVRSMLSRFLIPLLDRLDPRNFLDAIVYIVQDTICNSFQLFDFKAKKKQPDFGLHLFLFNIEPQPFGELTAHEMNHLSLLPSGPDEVRKISLRETKTLRLDLKKNGGE